MTLIEREAEEMATEHCSAADHRPCVVCLERARILAAGCTGTDGRPIGPRGAVDALCRIVDEAASGRIITLHGAVQIAQASLNDAGGQ